MCDAIRELFAEELEEGMQLGLQRGISQGREQGLARGREQGITIAKMVFRMNAEGKDIDEIAQAGGLTREEVQKILND